MNNNLSFCFLLFIVTACGKKESVIQYYKNGKVYSEANYVDGKPDGEVKVYYPNSKLEKILNYKNGIQDGIYRRYHPNGKINILQNVKEGVIDGKCNIFYPNGNKEEVANYIKGKREGESNVYYESGKIHEISYYVNDELEGRRLTYSENGKLLIDANYINGKYINGIHYNYKGKTSEKILGVGDGDIQRFYTIDSVLFFVKQLAFEPSEDKFILFNPSGEIEYQGNIDFLSRKDSLSFDRYYPGWQKKIIKQ